MGLFTLFSNNPFDEPSPTTPTSSPSLPNPTPPPPFKSAYPPKKETSTLTTLSTILCISFFALGFFPSAFHYTFITFPYSLLYTIPVPQLNTYTSLPSRSYPNIYAIPRTMWHQTTLTLPSKSRGAYLITDHILAELPQIKDYKIGLLTLFIQHTSCALSLNENYDEDVRSDMSDALDRLAPEETRTGSLYRHNDEGKDDMPAHIKSALVGVSVTIPIRDGELATGMWQGIWYLEFRASKHSRKVVATIQGETS